MSGLAAVLAHRKEPGIYRWHGHFKDEDVRHTVEHAGWHYAHIDGWHGETKADFLRAAGEALRFPEHYGQNFDALADCLGDVTPATARAGCCSGTAGARWPATTSAPSRCRSRSSAAGSTPSGAARSWSSSAATAPTSTECPSLD